jgi:glyoxylate utilization-related uncharacterized protein
MKTISLVVAAALSVPLPAGAAEAGKKGGSAVLLPADAVVWKDVPGFEGLKMGLVEGDAAKGASHFFMRFANGFSAPLHFHSANHFVVAVAGTIVLSIDGKETRLPPGSYFAFTGKKKHTTRCETGADCVLFVDARGKWDVVPAEAKK